MSASEAEGSRPLRDGEAFFESSGFEPWCIGYTNTMRHQSPMANKETLAAAIAGARSQKEVVENLGLRAAGGSTKLLKEWAAKHQLDLPVWDNSQNRPPTGCNQRYSDEEVFVENGTASRGMLKTRLRKLRVFECVECGMGEQWRGKPLTLVLDHINGIHNDNRLENLQLLCPNCNSQGDTFAGRNARIREKFKICSACKVNKCRSVSVQCRKCAPRPVKQPKISWPSVDIVLTMVVELGYTESGRQLGVSDNAIKKHLRTRGANVPVRPNKKK